MIQRLRFLLLHGFREPLQGRRGGHIRSWKFQVRSARWSPLGIFSLLVSSICAVDDRLVSKMKDAINKANQPFTFRVPLNEYGENPP